MNYYQLIKHPRVYTKSNYDMVFEIILNGFKNNSSVKSIYTFGNINQPGISDIDLLFVFKEGTQCNENPLDLINNKSKWLFTHNVMAINEKYWNKNNYFSNWSNIKHQLGDKLDFNSEKPSIEQNKILNKQLALEYLIINYIDLKIQKAYRTIKVRDVLQHVKGLAYDLELLEIKNSRISKYIDDVKEWIREWFINQPSDKTIINWFIQFEAEYELFMTEIFQSYSLYVPLQKSYHLSKRIQLVNANQLNHLRTGFILPSIASIALGKWYLKLQNNLNSHVFEIPTTNTPEDSILLQRNKFYIDLNKDTMLHYPKFATLANSIIRSLNN